MRIYQAVKNQFSIENAFFDSRCLNLTRAWRLLATILCVMTDIVDVRRYRAPHFSMPAMHVRHMCDMRMPLLHVLVQERDVPSHPISRRCVPSSPRTSWLRSSTQQRTHPAHTALACRLTPATQAPLAPPVCSQDQSRPRRLRSSSTSQPCRSSTSLSAQEMSGVATFYIARYESRYMYRLFRRLPRLLVKDMGVV